MGLQINQKLVPLKAHYFLYNAATAPIVPYIPTMARQLGFSTVIVGFIYMILPIIGMIAKPMFGAIADKFQRQKSLFLMFQLLTGIAFFCIMFIPSIPQSRTVEMDCNNGQSVLKHCDLADNDNCSINPLINDQTDRVMVCKLQCKMDHSWMWDDVVCKYWNVPAYCNRTSTEISFTTGAKMQQIDLLNECLYVPIHNATFSDGSISTMYCPSNASVPLFKTNCEANCNDATFTELITELKISDKEAVRLYQFWMFFLFLILSWVGMAVVVSVGDAICFEMLEDRPHLYGNQRLFGSIGWGTFSVISGLLIDTFSEGQSVKNYTVVFFMTMVMILIDMYVSAKLKHTQKKISPSIVKDVGKILKSIRIQVFFVWCVLVGLCTALIWNFLFWHLEDLATASNTCDHMAWIKTLQGLAMGIQCFGGELPFFFLSGWIIKKIGHVHSMSLVLLGFAFRFYFYSILSNPWWVLPIELLNGVTFGIFYSTMASYASIISPVGCEATLQGLAGGVFEGVGVSIGSLVGGTLFSKIGGSNTFLWFSVMAFVGFICHIVLQWFLQKYSNTPGKDNKSDCHKINETMLTNYATPANSGGSFNNGGPEPNDNDEKNPNIFKDIDLK